jgi:hypothetical protein
MSRSVSLLKNLSFDEKTGCWNWTAARNERGYGVIRYLGRTVLVHRLAAYLWMHFDLESNLDVCHRCDNPACFYPKHLFVGTRLENVKDCVAKNRHSFGEKHGLSKLSNADVVEIHMLHSQGKSLLYISDKFGVGKSNVCMIVKGKSRLLA